MSAANAPFFSFDEYLAAVTDDLGDDLVGARLLRTGLESRTGHHEHRGASVLSWRSFLALLAAVIVLASIDGCTSPPAAPMSSSQVAVVPPGSPLPSDATCAAQVRPAAEVRPDNAQYNSTRGSQKNLTGPYPMFNRVDGNFTGTTDEIIQWTACKWGINPDVVRAQAVVESYWYQKTLGDTTKNAGVCAPHHPIGSDPNQPGLCPESVGLLQVRYQYWSNGFDDVETSTAYNSDYVYAAWRSCYEGRESWLNTVDHVGTYGPGDIWGCLGVWFSGQWHTRPADQYISKVKSAFQNRTWTTSSFRHG